MKTDSCSSNVVCFALRQNIKVFPLMLYPVGFIDGVSNDWGIVVLARALKGSVHFPIKKFHDRKSQHFKALLKMTIPQPLLATSKKSGQDIK